MGQTVLFHHDLARKEQCTSVCTKITPVLLLTLYLVRIHAACLIVNLLLVLCGRRFLQVLGEITQCRLVDTRCETCVAARGVVRDCLPLKHHRATCAKSSFPSSRASGKPSVFLSSGQL